MINNSYEAIVIGSGATGGIAALTLAQKGIKVLVIEAGPQFTPRQALGGEPLNTANRLFSLLTGTHRKQAQHPGFWKANPALYANEKENVYLNPKARPFLWTRGKQVGGKSLTWGGITLRLSDYDFHAAKKDGFGESWPINLADISSNYSSIEKLLEVYGNKDNLEQLPDGEYIGNLPHNNVELGFINKVKAELGYPVINSRGFESHNNSDKNWPRYSSLGSSLKSALSTGNVHIISKHIAEKLVMHSYKNVASGVIIVDQDNGRRKLIKSNLIVLCASTINSLRFLLASENKYQENGFKDNSRILGTKIMDHISICRFFSIPNPKKRIIENNNISQNKLSGAGSFFIPFGNKISNYSEVDFLRGYGIWGAIDRFEPPGILKKDPSRKIGFLIAHGEVLPYKKNKVTLSNKLDKWGIAIPEIDCQWGENEKKMVNHMKATISQIIESGGGEMLPLYKIINVPFMKILTEKSFATQEEAPPPGYYIHEVGGAPMGLSRETSVVDKWNRLWECKNVLVVDGACWPSSSWQSPTLTMMALTQRACLKAIQSQKG